MSDKFYTILLDDTVEIFDKSLLLKEYDTPATSLELTVGSTLYIGFYKKFNSFYLQLETISIADADLQAEYFNGSVWQALIIYDESQGFSKSGFIYFDTPSDMTLETVDGKEKYYIRLSSSIDTGPVTAKLLDTLFSSDIDLTKIRSNIVEKFSVNGTWIDKNIQARDHIIQEIRNRGNIKVISQDNGSLAPDICFKDITKHDFLEPLQLRVPSTYLALYFIFWYELSDEEGDKWQIKAAEMYRLYEKTIETFYLALDLDDDGVKAVDGSDKAEGMGAIRTIVTC